VILLSVAERAGIGAGKDHDRLSDGR